MEEWRVSIAGLVGAGVQGIWENRRGRADLSGRWLAISVLNGMRPSPSLRASLAQLQYHRGVQTLDMGDRVAEYQPSLLSNQDLKAAEVSWAYNRSSAADAALTGAELTAWKERIHQFQQTVKRGAGETQGTLFAMTAPSLADDLDPFTLPQRNAEFWREQFTDAGNAALYFVVDHEADLLLYVGETVKANQRWKGTHDCKRYILNYVSAHRAVQLPVQVNIGFWPYAPEDRKARQSLESELIRKWRSPFNKENWRRWATPFIGAQP